MQQRPQPQSTIVVKVICILCPILIFGCAMSPAPVDDSNPTQLRSNNRQVPLYYDFGDVLIPSNLKLKKKNSFVFRTPGLSAGVLSFKGDVEINRLISFFESNMAKDNWRPVSSFKSPRTIMLYQKENRWCVISITENRFSTDVEIWVAPTVGEPELGLLK